MIDIIFATSNSNKVLEVQEIFKHQSFCNLAALNSVDNVPADPEETETTFQGNAILKARYYSHNLERVCLSEDSGLEVDALGGAPGVYSARYSGVKGNIKEIYAANNKLLIENLKGVKDRTARLICAMCLCDADGRVMAETIGKLEGLILPEIYSKDIGFGYDPIFYIPKLHCTNSELTKEEKNTYSHRGSASRQMLNKIQSLFW
jgi:XTP/dITP diphosphohydrolase